jgi:hypothetical protein
MYMHVQLAAVMLPLLHPTLPSVATDLHPVPIPISGVVCSSAHDMAGLYAVSASQSIKSIDELLGLARDTGYRCQVLKNTLVFNWGPVAGPEGTVQVPGAKPVTIVEVIEPDGTPDKHYFLIAKTR